MICIEEKIVMRKYLITLIALLTFIIIPSITAKADSVVYNDNNEAIGELSGDINAVSDVPKEVHRSPVQTATADYVEGIEMLDFETQYEIPLNGIIYKSYNNNTTEENAESGDFCHFEGYKQAEYSVYLDNDENGCIVRIKVKISIISDKKLMKTLPISFELGGRTFSFDMQFDNPLYAYSSYYLVKGKKLKLPCVSDGRVTKVISHQKKYVTVKKDGTLYGKNNGCSLIEIQIDDGRKIYTAVNVIPNKKIVNVLKRQVYIMRHWKYNQNKRQKKGYYDCSALVERSYKEKMGLTFGNKNSYGWTGSEIDWCKKHCKKIKYAHSKAYKKMQKQQLKKNKNSSNGVTVITYDEKTMKAIASDPVHYNLAAGDIGFVSDRLGKIEDTSHVQTFQGFYVRFGRDGCYLYESWIFDKRSVIDNLYVYRPCSKK